MLESGARGILLNLSQDPSGLGRQEWVEREGALEVVEHGLWGRQQGRQDGLQNWVKTAQHCTVIVGMAKCEGTGALVKERGHCRTQRVHPE